ncbi:MAG: hypothetical protein HYV09_25525 [Deltaproteobacteria bacterium]|nr:hypothetical protein [Deltaproteobacteria bacterium]
MSFQRPSLSEPFELVRRAPARESFAEWFDAPPRSSSSLLSIEPPLMIVVRGAGELSPGAAGAMAGALAGPASLTVFAAFVADFGRLHHAVELAASFGAFASRGALSRPWAVAVGWALTVVSGAVLGAAFGRLTRRLRAFAPLFFFAVVLSFAFSTVLHGVVLHRWLAWLLRALPYGPFVVAAMTFGAVLALQAPIRTRHLV